jgi:hypothetical protein
MSPASIGATAPRRVLQHVTRNDGVGLVGWRAPVVTVSGDNAQQVPLDQPADVVVAFQVLATGLRYCPL